MDSEKSRKREVRQKSRFIKILVKFRISGYARYSSLKLSSRGGSSKGGKIEQWKKEKKMNSKAKIKLLCFDVNGTLLDDTTSFLNAINGIFLKFGKPPLPLDILKERFGQPWTKIYRDEGISETMASDEKLYEIYNALYQAESLPSPFAGLRLTLGWLKNKNIALAIVSTQQNSITLPLLKRYGLDIFFSHLEGGVSDKAQALRRVFNCFGAKAEEAAYVGDQEGDVIHAKKAGCISIVFCGGLHTLERLSKAQPDFLIHSHSEIKSLPIFD